MRTIHFSAMLLVSLALAACSGVGSATLSSMTESEVVIQSGSTVGQTFVAENAGLNGLLVYLDPEGELSGEVRLHLRSDSQAKTDISQSIISANQITQADSYLFAIDPQTDSFRKYYYAFLEYEGNGLIWVGNAQADSYLDGALYVDHRPVDLQMGFQLTYHPGYSALGFLRELLYWVALLLVAIFLFIIPGFSVVTLLVPYPNELRWSSRMVLGVGISLGLYPILLLLADLIGIKLGVFLAWVPGFLGSLILIGRAFTQLKSINIFERLKSWRDSDDFLPNLTTVLVVAMIIGVRFFIIRVIDLPLWGDSLTHSMISQLIADNDGLFQSWVPYAELESLTYHFGFHSHIAVFHWITNIPIPQSALWMGQIINILAVLSLYPVAQRIGRSKWAGISSIAIAGLLLSMPNFYSNWGRYTQLTGQAILPAIILLAWWLRDKKQISIIPAVLMGLIMAGLGLVHYRLLVIAIVLIFVLVVDQMIREMRSSLIYNFTISTIIGTIVFLPWFARLLGGKLLANAAELISTPSSSTSDWIQQYNAIGDLFVYLPEYIWGLLFLSTVWAVFRQNRFALTIGTWWLLLLLVANPQIIGLSGQGLLSNFAIFIAMYIPAGLLIGGAIGWLLSVTPNSKRVIPIAVVLVASLGGITRLSDLEPLKHSLAARPDIHAWAWIEENIPADAKFLTNSFFAYGETIIVGSDGGWWLPLMTQRLSNLPPINYGTERGLRPDNIPWQNDLVHQLQRGGIDDDNSLEMIRERGISHIYIGQQQGKVNAVGSMSLDPDLLNASSLFKSIYNQDRVWIFEIAQ